MSKEVEEAIERLNGIDIKFFLAGSMEQSNYVIETADKVNKAIETVLNCIKELENKLADSTSNEVIIEKLEIIINKLEENDFGGWADELRDTLDEILEGEKK